MAGDGNVFVSHAHADNAVCDRYVQALRARGLDVWYDQEDMRAGNTLTDVIERELRARSNFVVILTPASVTSHWVKMETAAFHDLVSRDRSRLILPVRAGDCEVPLLLRGLKWVDAVQMGFDLAIEEIVAALYGPPALSAQPAATTPPRSNPMARLFGRSSPPSGSATTTRKPDLIVDAKGKGNYRTISEAIDAAPSDTIILVRPGIYREALKIGNPVELRGDGRREGVVIETVTEGATIDIWTQGHIRMSNFTIRHSHDDLSYAIDIGSGQIEVENCVITSSGFSAIHIHYKSEVAVHNCHIQTQGVCSGMHISAGHVTLSNNEILGGGASEGINTSGGEVIARRNRITKFSNAIEIQSGGGGTFENNDLRGNYDVWNIAPDAGKVIRSGNKE